MPWSAARGCSHAIAASSGAASPGCASLVDAGGGMLSLPSARESGMIPAMPPPHQRTEAVFVGRHDELVELRAGLEDAVTGRGRFFLVVGEAGVGKTRLVEELGREAAERGHLVLWGRCWEGEGAPPYWP